MNPNPNILLLAMLGTMIVPFTSKDILPQTSMRRRRARNAGAVTALAALAVPAIALSTTSVRAELVTISSKAGAKAKVNSSVKNNFVAFIEDFEATGGKILFMGGWRSHGSCSRCVMHPRGLALDICQHARNVVDSRCRFPRDATALAEKHGLDHGAKWNNKDTGHFEVRLKNRTPSNQTVTAGGLSPTRSTEARLGSMRSLRKRHSINASKSESRLRRLS